MNLTHISPQPQLHANPELAGAGQEHYSVKLDGGDDYPASKKPS